VRERGTTGSGMGKYRGDEVGFENTEWTRGVVERVIARIFKCLVQRVQVGRDPL